LLAQEMRGTNVRVQALCPGFVRTGFHSADGMKSFQKSPATHMWMTAEEVVDYALAKLSTKQVLIIPGLGYKIVSRLARMPFVQPIMQWVTWVPRPAPKAVLKPEAEVAAEPAFDRQPASASPRMLEETAS
jgi:short-subunit dehydrogenase